MSQSVSQPAPPHGRAIALVAHDLKKPALVAWCGRHLDQLRRFPLIATGTTGGRIQDAFPELQIERMKSGPQGGDQQIGARIVEGRVMALIFFVDPLTPMPHDVDVKALTRIATVYDIPCAQSSVTADCILYAIRDGHIAVG
ncbi:methylglyoxal synthase [Blastochloris viridis]|uniref:Methylglyoxal synthase n=1 Tax=Blastochloris viridis TaxID=1079 RepID=A0A0H5BDL4_BLAVI|nr:methylglyoxal synthase [Blastochloris viridis]ALK08320.1 Methylglyoxal synthase [Blastochloris viridis]BAR98411.1 methylglyoxal synthase [Blastochloris viridis]CUU44242.1 Methylglyoxal synthase [Blastochloris viridis]